MTDRLTRRTLVIGAAAGIGVITTGFGLARQVIKEIHELEPGEYVWQPELSPEGPVAVVVSLDDQRVHVYRNGVRIAVSTCSTGKSGHETPTGVFTILQKDKHHHSSTYNNAPMPNMNRLTWKGIALHAGKLPGYPASHGCVRLPMQFSEKLFSITHIGTPVIIAGGHTDPREVVHPGMILSDTAEHQFEEAVAALEDREVPGFDHEDNPTAPVTILVSSSDSNIIVMKNGHIVAESEATISDPMRPLGNHVYVLAGAHDSSGGLQWHSISHGDVAEDLATADAGAINRIRADTTVVQAIRENWHPGTTLITVDAPAHPDTRSNRDFVVVTTELDGDKA
ncbi:L,D-transpeptidase [Hoeflea sp. WL0058]|uniref:L,D-transpeptidase n=1 Tax=Flavimaribacter sediminis TaxID=2865987 RepID=A0AAE2ZGX3_9HYPH|nr:L,D-transpeptidase [Flavimaribacter sediminis]MBW8635981.1 L,D-transpeptidase [Flavimaribacter sediminis]